MQSIYLKCLIAFYYAINGVILPYFPVLFQKQGFHYWQIGVLLAMGAVVNTLTQSLWGYLCDKMQTVKKIMLLQLFISAVLSIFVFRFQSFLGLLVALTLFFTFYRPLPSLIDTLIVNAVKENPSHYGSYRMFGSLGFLASVFCSGFVLNSLGINNGPYLVTALIALTFLCALPIEDAKYICNPPSFRNFTSLTRKPQIIWFFITATLLGTTQVANDNFISVHLQNLGGSIQETGLAWTIGVSSEVLAFIVLSRLGKNPEPLRLLPYVSCLYGLRWLLMAFITNIKVILVIQVLHGICFALFISMVMQQLLKIIPDELRATGQGLFYMFVFGIGGIMGMTGGGIILDYLGAKYFYLTCLLFSLFALGGFSRQWKTDYNQS